MKRTSSYLSRLLLILSSVFLFCSSTHSQITGPSTVTFGDEETYTHPIIGTPDVSECFWRVWGGTITQHHETYIDVKWNITSAEETKVEKWVVDFATGVETRISTKVVNVNIPVVKYTYDENGNRTERYTTIMQVDQLKSSKPGKEDQEPQEELVLKVYPNPTDGMIKIVIQESIQNEFPSSIIVYDLNGRLVKQLQSIDYTNVVDLSSEKSGVYLLTVSANNKVSRWKIVKK